MNAISELALDYFPVVIKSGSGVCEGTAKTSSAIMVDQGHRDFANFQNCPGGLNPQLKRQSVTFLGKFELAEGCGSISFESAKRIGKLKAEFAIEHPGNFSVYSDPVRRWNC